MDFRPLARVASFTAHRVRVGRHGRARRCGGSREDDCGCQRGRGGGAVWVMCHLNRGQRRFAWF